MAARLKSSGAHPAEFWAFGGGGSDHAGLQPETDMLILAIALATATPADVDPTGYFELMPGALLPLILAELKNTLADPYSIRDFTLCPARSIKLKEGKPVSWQVSIAFNAKNSFGGYTGRKTYSALFRNGVLRGGISSTQFAKTDGIEGLINSMVVKKMASCPQVADDEIQRLLSHEASPIKTVQ
ncbi:hypothetical protein [Sphingomonas sp. RS2018]